MIVKYRRIIKKGYWMIKAILFLVFKGMLKELASGKGHTLKSWKASGLSTIFIRQSQLLKKECQSLIGLRKLIVLIFKFNNLKGNISGSHRFLPLKNLMNQLTSKSLHHLQLENKWEKPKWNRFQQRSWFKIHHPDNSPKQYSVRCLKKERC